jgi:general secretion pathway protein L
MARLVGIDITPTHVRAAVLRATVRGIALEELSEVPISDPADLSNAISACVGGFTSHGEPVAIDFDGGSAFFHRIDIPKTAARRIDEVLPFEVEAKLPIDIDDVVFGWQRLRSSAEDVVPILAAAARIDAVRDCIDAAADGLGREPDRVSAGALALANLSVLSAELADKDPILVVNFSEKRVEMVVVKSSEPWLVRHTGWLSEPTVQQVTASLRQTIAAYAAETGESIAGIRLCGDLPLDPSFPGILNGELNISVSLFGDLKLDGLESRATSEVSRFAKALGVALGLRGRARDIDLRQGELSYQRGYGFLKEKTPLLAGLIVAILISFGFSLWAEYSAINREQDALVAQLRATTKRVFNVSVDDPDLVEDTVRQMTTGMEKDPMPIKDGFDVLLDLSRLIPTTISHEIRDFDFQREHVKIHGTVDKTEEAQTIKSALITGECVNADDVKMGKITKMINSDRQKYSVEYDLKCSPTSEVASAKGAQK